MKKFLAMAIMMTCIQTFAQSRRIHLSDGESIILEGTQVSCNTNSQHNNPARACNRFKNMSEDQVYNLGLREGFGTCWIINNGGYFGVMSNGKQVSPTYTTSSNGNSSYDRNSYSVSTGFVQLVCSGECTR